MAVDLSIIFDEKVREFSVRGDNERFSADFITAARQVVRMLQIHGAQDVTLDTVTGTATSLDAIAEQYTYVVADGITFYLMRTGQKPRDGRSIDKAEADWLESEGDYLMGYLQNSAQTDSNDIVGLGSIGRDV